MRVAVAGATGFVGRRLVPALVAAGHDVVALTRRPQAYRPPAGARVRAVAADVDDAASLGPALRGAAVVVDLVHRLGEADLVEREVAGARSLGRAAADAGARQLVHLGGLVPPALAAAPDGRLSAHMRGRLLSATALGEAGVPVTQVRASIVLGAGSAAWEVLRQIAVALPVMAAPLRARTRTQPIAAADLVGYLVDVLGDPRFHGRVLEVGGPDVVTYRQLMTRAARAVGQPGFVVWVPTMPALLQEAALRSLTDVDADLGLALLRSLDHDAVVTDDAAERLLPRRPVPLDAAIRRALDEPRDGSAA